MDLTLSETSEDESDDDVVILSQAPPAGHDLFCHDLVTVPLDTTCRNCKTRIKRLQAAAARWRGTLLSVRYEGGDTLFPWAR